MKSLRLSNGTAWPTGASIVSGGKSRFVACVLSMTVDSATQAVAAARCARPAAGSSASLFARAAGGGGFLDPKPIASAGGLEDNANAASAGGV